jgi:hypothetical protein
LAAIVLGQSEMALLCIDFLGEVEHRRRPVVCHLLDQR